MSQRRGEDQFRFLQLRLARLQASLARAASEANAALRALAPAWPVFACATVAAIALLAPAQGRIALLIDASAPLFGSGAARSAALAAVSDWAGATMARAWVTVFAVYLFALSMMVLALYAMSLRPPTPDESSAKAIERERMPADPVHPSITLRLSAAKFAGLIAPGAMLLTLGVFLFQESRVRDWPGADWFLVGALVIVVAAAAGFLWLAKRVEPSLYRLDRRLRDAASAWRARREAAGGDRRARQDAAAAFMAAWRRRAADAAAVWPEAWRALRAHAVWSAAALIEGVLFTAPRAAFDVLRWLLSPKRMELYGVAASTAAFIFFLAAATPSASDSSTREVKTFAYALVAAAVLAALTFDRLRDSAMRVIGARDRKELIVDRHIQTRLRAVSFMITLSILALFWSVLTPYSDYASQAVGPTSAMLLGLLVTASVLVWFVRNAITPPRINPPPPKLALRPWITLPIRAGFAALDRLGAMIEHAQRWAPGQVIFGVGLWLALIAGPGLWCARQALAWAPDAWPTSAAWAITIAVGVVAPAVVAWIGARLAVAILGSGAPPEDPATGTTLSPRTALLPTPVLLLPFLLSGLGENLEPDRYGARAVAAPAAQERPIAAHAEAWLQNAAARAGPGAPIPAIIVLAEGGGVRAASHVGALLAALDEPGPETERGVFGDIYTISAVSGGAIGAADFLATRASASAAGCAASRPSLEASVSRLRTQDRLTPLVMGLFASDFLSTFLPLNLHIRMQRIADPQAALERPWPRLAPNRGDFFELALRKAGREAAPLQDEDAARDWFAEPIETVVAAAAACDDAAGAGSAPGPIVLFGAFGADSQIRAAASNVDFGACASGLPGAFVNVRECRHGGGNFSLAAAAHMSARFPLSNPPSVVMIPDGEGSWRAERFVDGGYFDNSGAAIAREALHALRDAAANNPGLAARLRVVVLHIFVREPASVRARAAEATLNEITAPFEALWSARDSSALMPVSTLCGDVADEGTRRNCDALAGLRTVSDDAADAIVFGPTICAGAAPAWLNAALDNADSEITAGFFPLGWLMRPESHVVIAARQGAVARQIAGAIDALRRRNPAPDARCGQEG
ncbi:MAG: hypothetical protein GC206_16700 [Alphaproteobacteria bacterium]|nr:hypothetical protein [Alphaproteobacteria bacterium]